MDFVDALPYIDKEIDEDPKLKGVVEKLVIEELKAFDRGKMYEEKVNLQTGSVEWSFKSKILQNTYELLENGNKVVKFNRSRYALVNPKAQAEGKTRTTWEAAIQQLKRTIEYQRNWLINSQLCRTYGERAWTVHCSLKEGLAAQAANQLDYVEAKQKNINKQRKARQLKVKPELNFIWSQSLDIAKKNSMIASLLSSNTNSKRKPNPENEKDYANKKQKTESA